MAVQGLRPLPPAAALLPSQGVFVADHAGATRAMLALLWEQTKAQGPAGLQAEDAREAAWLVRGALVQVARAESALLDAAFLRIRPEHASLPAARALVAERIDALRSAQEHLERAQGMLGEAVQRDGSVYEASDGTDEPAPPKKKKKKKGGKAQTGGDLAKEALAQVSELLDAIKALVEKLAPKKNDDDKIAKLIATIAGLILTGTKAALVGAIAQLLKEIDSDATPEDIHIKKGPDGSIMIFFRVRKGCLFIFDWAVKDDYIFIRKGGKSDEWEWASGDEAKEAHETYKKTAAGAPPASGGSAPKSPPPPSKPEPPSGEGPY